MANTYKKNIFVVPEKNKSENDDKITIFPLLHLNPKTLNLLERSFQSTTQFFQFCGRICSQRKIWLD